MFFFILQHLGLDFVKHDHRLLDHSFAGADLGKIVRTDPGLIAPQLERFAVGQIADPIVGQLDDNGLFERRLFFDLEPQAGEKLARHADNRHVADQNHLHGRLPLFPLLALQLGPGLAKYCACTSPARRAAWAVQ